VLFMISMVFTVLAAFGFVVWQSFRGARKHSGKRFEPHGNKRRWDEPPQG
jgi:hypothetical protein